MSDTHEIRSHRYTPPRSHRRPPRIPPRVSGTGLAALALAVIVAGVLANPTRTGPGLVTAEAVPVERPHVFVLPQIPAIAATANPAATPRPTPPAAPPGTAVVSIPLPAEPTPSPPVVWQPAATPSPTMSPAPELVVPDAAPTLSPSPSPSPPSPTPPPAPAPSPTPSQPAPAPTPSPTPPPPGKPKPPHPEHPHATPVPTDIPPATEPEAAP